MPPRAHWFLAGFAGSGKSTVGKHLAVLAGRPFVDLDRIVEQITGRSLADLFVTGGEKVFRSAEEGALRSLCAKLRDPAIVALGGGSLISRHNQRLVSRCGKSIYLKCSRKELVQRLMRAPVRPLLKRERISRSAMSEKISILMSERLPGYVQCDYAVTVTRRSPRDAARRIYEILA